jgi:tRNA nucleotidyltransferase (CCA-adding enzyme)
MTLPKFAQSYLVGGAVRDRLLGLPVGDRDYVVVGATPEAMVAAGFRPVGADFPVFLHPTTAEEYALARTERKSGRGYKGFAFHAAPEVTLEQDLARRDLTINAVAEDSEGRLVDPYGGVRDLEARVLRHVSPAFIEDPLRVLRVARFAARFAPLGFAIAPETMALMREIAESGELEHLVPERVFVEMRKTLEGPRPGVFLRVLRDTGALAVLLPELDRLYGTPQRPEFHPEVDAGLHQELVSDMAARLAPGDALVGWAALLHDLGKGITPRDELPKHLRHEFTGLPLVDAVSIRFKAPAEYAALARLVCRHHLEVHRAFELRATTVLELIESLDAIRRPERMAALTLACEADKRGRLGREDDDYPQGGYLRECLDTVRAIGAEPFVARGLHGEAIGAAMRVARLEAIAHLREVHTKG